MIEFNNVCKVYDSGTPKQVDALHNISIKINDGEFVYIIGANGSGKSTFVKLLTAEERITSGTVTFDNYRLHRIRRSKIPYLRRNIGMVFQDFRLIETKTVYQNIAFALHVTGATQREIRTRVPAVLDVMGLTAKAKCFPHELSGGEQQRVGVARALVTKPKLIIADEPTGNIDPEMSLEILGLLEEINQLGTTVIMVTHQREFLRIIPHRVVLLEQGVAIFDEDLSKGFPSSQAEEAIEEMDNEPPVDESIKDHEDFEQRTVEFCAIDHDDNGFEDSHFSDDHRDDATTEV